MEIWVIFPALQNSRSLPRNDLRDCGRCKRRLEEGAFAPSQWALGSGRWCRECKRDYDLEREPLERGETICCARCAENLPRDAYFPSAVKSKTRNGIWCKECQQAYYRERKDVEGGSYFRLYTKQYRHRNRAHVDQIKVERECVHCGESEPVCLDFHHRDRTSKKLDICGLVQTGCSLETLQKEIDKCDILCANCHRKVEAGIRARLRMEA